MARGHHGSPPTSALPKVSFEKVKDEVSEQPPGVHSNQLKSFGYNDLSDFRRPDHYIRHIEPLESDLATTVEYDMDEQDQEWLDSVNADRKREQLDTVSFETFEIVMDRLEKEWFDLTKNLPKSDFAMPSEDSTCAICDDSEGENSNAIVFCDGCNLAVHQDCYGVPYIPEGQWLCRKCTVSPEVPVECALCPNEGGAFKQTNTGEWIHLLCAIWVPETRIVNEVFMEPIVGLEEISKQRWKLRCSICDTRTGACIQCAKASCFVAFHATCARKEKLLSPMKTAQGAEPLTLTCYCEKHLSREQQAIREAAFANDDTRPGSQLTPKSARAYAKTYKPGPPLVPAIVFNRIMQYIGKITVRKKSEFVQMMCRYWSLKREARRGAPLLKRLHLEPWTSAGGKVQTEEQMVMQLELLEKLRDDLLHVRELADLCRKRETRKMRGFEVIGQVLHQALFPHDGPLRLAFEKIIAMDRNEIFKSPVSPSEVPDYFEVVKKPMCWSTIDTKLDQHEYWNVEDFKDDVELVLRNAMLYNKPGSAFHRTAAKILQSAQPYFVELQRLATSHPTPEDDKDLLKGDWSAPPVGDLEPPMDVLELLLSSDAIKEDLNMELDEGPLTSLFDYTLARMKPQPPEALSPVKPPPRSRKPKKRDRKAEAERLRQRRAAEAAARAALEQEEQMANGTDGVSKDFDWQTALDTSPGFRASRTRGSFAHASDVEPHTSSGSAFETPGDRARKKASIVSPVPGSVPRVVDVGRKDSFSLFNQGWILPEDHKRGGRSDRVSSTNPPPSKKQRFDSARGSIVSMEPDHRSEENGDEQLVEKDSMSIDPTTGQTISGVNGEPIDVPHNVVTQPNGVVIIEKLDTPAIRRERNMRKKAERRRMEQGNGRTRGGKTDEEESDLSDLSDSPSMDKPIGISGSPTRVDNRPVLSNSVTLPSSTKKRNPPNTKKPAKAELYPDGTLVWAKTESYPWWPAVVFKDDNPIIPSNVLIAHTQKRQKRKIKLYIVQFYDKQQSWQSVAREKLQLLGEDPTLDQEMLTSNQKQKWKNASSKAACRDAYRRAVADMDPQSNTNPAQPFDTTLLNDDTDDPIESDIN